MIKLIKVLNPIFLRKKKVSKFGTGAHVIVDKEFIDDDVWIIKEDD